MSDAGPSTPGKGHMTTPNGKTPTTNDAMFFYYIVKNMKSKADIDWVGVAADHGFKNADVAKVRFGQVKRKLGITEPTPTRTPAARATPAKEAKVKKTPTGRVGTKGRKAKKEETKSDEGDDDVKMEEVPEEATDKKVKDEAKVKGEATDEDDDGLADAQLQGELNDFLTEPLF